MKNFGDGLIVTGLGMGLVFLTLIIVMYSIKLLDWVFKPRVLAPGAVVQVPPAAMVAPEAPPSSAPEAEAALADEAAAIAVALALAKARLRPAVQMAWAAPRPASAFDIDYENEILGEVVTVTSIDPGPGTWKAQGRLKALQ
jgi:Na+-transporting methylmalonyl-CoA/oxaloacetate decarboxylase gamma subunit